MNMSTPYGDSRRAGGMQSSATHLEFRPAPRGPAMRALSCVTQPTFQAKVWRRFTATGASRSISRASVEWALATYRPAHRVSVEHVLGIAATQGRTASPHTAA